MKKSVIVKQPAEHVQTCMELAQELSAVPELFSSRNEPAPFFAEPRYSGSRVTLDAQRCVMVGALKLLGCSDREIARVAKCDVRSIPLMVEELERSGQIPALKQRLEKSLGSNAEASGIALKRMLDKAADGFESVELAAMIKAAATALGITVEKLQLVTGQATEIVEHKGGAGREAVESWARANAIEIEGAVDLQSGLNAPKPLQIQGVGKRDTADDTCEAAREGLISGGGGGGAMGGLRPTGERFTGSQNIIKEAS